MLASTASAPRVTRCSLGLYWSRDLCSKQALAGWGMSSFLGQIVRGSEIWWFMTSAHSLSTSLRSDWNCRETSCACLDSSQHPASLFLKKSRHQYFPSLHRVTRVAHSLGTSMLCLWGCGSRGCISLIYRYFLKLWNKKKKKNCTPCWTSSLRVLSLFDTHSNSFSVLLTFPLISTSKQANTGNRIFDLGKPTGTALYCFRTSAGWYKSMSTSLNRTASTYSTVANPYIKGIIFQGL